ncbi:oligosaccharide flippase family protein [Sphingobium sp. Sx8-8]|uniref:lipopolysaccharide biosynthesis protein n=1 Tax=Sphingobium sp. Sx8-8 TaxID=2933617 RepID=UPI001F561768|nr:oligosaccharide flippase family protein [Sphingobium sp. Sx8-8]
MNADHALGRRLPAAGERGTMARLGSNLAFASISQILRYAAPLFIYPFLTRTLGVQAFGEFSTVMAVGLMCSVFVEFGYGLMSVRELASGDRKATAGVVFELCLGRGIMFLAAAAGLAIICHYVDLLPDRSSYFAALAIALVYGYSASWYYIAMERSKALAALDLCCSLATFGLILSFVRGPGHALLAVWIFAIPLFLIAAYGHVQAVRSYGLHPVPVRSLFASLAQSLRFFFFTGFPSLTNRWSVVALAIWSDPLQVVYFSAGEKLTTAAINSTVPITRVLLPRISRTMAGDPVAAYREIRKFTGIVGGLYLFTAIVTIALSQFIFTLMFGAKLAAGYPVFAVQMAMVPFAACSRVLVQAGFTTFKKEGFCAAVFIASTVAYILLSTLLAPNDGGIGIASARVAVEMIVFSVFIRSFIRMGRDVNGSSNPSPSLTDMGK